MKQVVLTKDSLQQVADELLKYNINLSVIRENDNLGKSLGASLFDIDCGELGSTFYPDDGTITFNFNKELGEVSYNHRG